MWRPGEAGEASSGAGDLFRLLLAGPGPAETQTGQPVQFIEQGVKLAGGEPDVLHCQVGQAGHAEELGKERAGADPVHAALC